MTTPTIAAPTVIVSAYERTKPFCTRRSRDDMPPIAAAVPFTAPSIPEFSKRTRPSVSCCPGRMNTASLKASP